MNGQQNNGTEKQMGKTKIYLTTDEVVGLLMEWASSFSLPDWMDQMVRRMQDKYDSVNDQPTEEEKVRFIAAIIGGIPNGFFIKDVAEQFLRNYEAGEDNE